MGVRPMIERGNWFVEFIEEWSQIFGGHNWYTCTLCRIEFENDTIMGGCEATAILLGVGLRWRWNHTQTETMKEIDRQIRDLDVGK